MTNNNVFIKFLGVLVDLHEPSVGRGESCGPLNVHTYQKYKAIEWAVETINNKSFPGEFSLGEINIMPPLSV